MGLKIRKNNNQHEDPEDGFPDPFAEVPGLIPEPQEIPAPEQEESPVEPEPVHGASSVDVLLHLGLGAVLLGINSVSKRLHEKQPQVVTFPLNEEPLSHPDDDQDQLRYALIGVILSTPKVISRGAAHAAHLANAGFNRINAIFRPVTSSRVARPINHRFDQMMARGERIVSDWIDTGRRGEKTSQALLQQTSDEVVGELVDMLASRAEIRELVEQQGLGMVDELTEELQGRASATDTIVERIVFSLIPGSKRDTTPTLIIPLREEEGSGKAKKKPPKGRS